MKQDKNKKNFEGKIPEVNRNSILIKKFLNFIASNNDSNHTIIAYRSDLKQFCKTNNNQDMLVDIDEKVEYYLNQVYRAKKRFTFSSIARKMSSLRAFYRFAYDEKLIDKMPMQQIKTPKLKTPVPKMLLKSEINAMLQQCEENFNTAEEKQIDWLILYAIIEFLYSTGCRISEALSVKIGMIFNNRNEINSEIIIKGKRREERMVFLNESCQKAIWNFLRTKYMTNNISQIKMHDDFLFAIDIISNEPMTRHKAYYLLRKVAMQCGIDKNRVSPHVFRHSVAIHMLMNKKDNSPNNIMMIKKFLGHKSIDTTKMYLGYDNIDNLSKTINTKHPLAML